MTEEGYVKNLTRNLGGPQALIHCASIGARRFLRWRCPRTYPPDGSRVRRVLAHVLEVVSISDRHPDIVNVPGIDSYEPYGFVSHGWYEIVLSEGGYSLHSTLGVTERLRPPIWWPAEPIDGAR